MRNYLTTIVLSLCLAGAGVAPATAAPASPGACHMFNVSPTGMDGMTKASERGLTNMMNLVEASFAANCSP
jgi:hypothetical protein